MHAYKPHTHTPHPPAHTHILLIPKPVNTMLELCALLSQQLQSETDQRGAPANPIPSTQCTEMLEPLSIILILLPLESSRQASDNYWVQIIHHHHSYLPTDIGEEGKYYGPDTNRQSCFLFVFNCCVHDFPRCVRYVNVCRWIKLYQNALLVL